MKETRAVRLFAGLAAIMLIGACQGGGAGTQSPAAGTSAPAATSAAPSSPAASSPAASESPAGSPAESPAGSPAESPSGSAGGGDYHIGLSNTIAGNGWREEMVCSVRAQALASGKVSKITVAHRNTDAAGQLEDMRNLIAAGVDAIIVNPNSPEAVNAAIKEATDAGIVVVAVDQAVTEPSAYLLANNQEEYGYLGGKWLFEQLNGNAKGVYMPGAAAASADNDRDKRFKRAFHEQPEI